MSDTPPIVTISSTIDLLEVHGQEVPAAKCDIRWNNSEVNRLAQSLNRDPAMIAMTLGTIASGVAKAIAQSVSDALITKGVAPESARQSLTDLVLKEAQDDSSNAHPNPSPRQR